jgi:V8-like Glu-specific endopeptidase
MRRGAMPPLRYVTRHSSLPPIAAAALRRTLAVLAAGAVAYLTTPVSLAAGDSALTLAARGERTVQVAGVPFRGTAAVGALFDSSGGRLTDHFCTASVVASPAGNLLITAAHCLQGKSLSPAGSVLFAPGYHDGTFPYGTWPVTAVYTDSRWQDSQDPDDDVAFLTTGGPAADVQQVTGAETLMVNQPPQQVTVIGYPGQTNEPLSCTAPARAFGATQMIFDCDNYTNGTSGGPFLANVGPGTGDGWVIGVIGGYQQGGDTPNVSYSPRLASSLLALYQTAISGAAISGG